MDRAEAVPALCAAAAADDVASQGSGMETVSREGGNTI